MPLELSIRLFYGSVLLTLIMLFSGCEEKQSDTAQTGTDQIIKSPNDQRDYRYVLLDNGLKVVLISDPQADKSAAAMAVFRGSSDEPEARPGLAHFLEHMLFIGTEKYPEADGYFSFVQAHGGNSNAYTGFDHTNYFFDIQPEYFKEGLLLFDSFLMTIEGRADQWCECVYPSVFGPRFGCHVAYWHGADVSALLTWF